MVFEITSIFAAVRNKLNLYFNLLMDVTTKLGKHYILKMQQNDSRRVLNKLTFILTALSPLTSFREDYMGF